MKTFLILIITAVSFLGHAQNNTLFEEANNLYNEGKYQEAITNYLKILENNEHSAALYYNLGNAHYKLNQIAPSIYYYEKALQLAPGDADVKNNLLFAQNMTIDAIEVMPKTGVSRIIQNGIDTFPHNTWAILSIAFMMLFVTGFLIYYMSRYQNRKRLFFALSSVAFIFAVLSFVFASYQYNTSKNERPAIVFEQEISVRAEPNERSEEVFVLHEGTKVEVQDALGEWKKIRLDDGKIGWLLSESIKEIKSF